MKEVAEKKMEIKFLDADIETKQNIIKELEQKESLLKQAPFIDKDQELERMTKQLSYFEEEVRSIEAKFPHLKDNLES